MEKKELMAELEGLKSSLETSISEKTKSEIADQLKSVISSIDEKMSAFASGSDSAEAVKAMTSEFNALKAEQAAILKGFDLLQTRVKSTGKNAESKKSFNDVFGETLKNNFEAFQQIKKGNPMRFDLKAVGTMTLGNNLTGDGVATYAASQAILPAQRTNMRDLLSTAISSTGLYVQYRETGSEGSISVQTEGSPKTQIDYDFSEIKIVEDYIAGFARFSKQMMKQLPWMETTLVRILTRDFFKAENAAFYADFQSQADSAVTSSETDRVKFIMDLIAGQNNNNFNASYALVNYTDFASLNKLLYTNGYYQGSGGVVSQPNGAITISGTPIVPASWMGTGKIAIFDRDYIERVETEAVAVEFSMEDSDNFQRNLITARIECQEALNVMLPASALHTDLPS